MDKAILEGIARQYLESMSQQNLNIICNKVEYKIEEYNNVTFEVYYTPVQPIQYISATIDFFDTIPNFFHDESRSLF